MFKLNRTFSEYSVFWIIGGYSIFDIVFIVPEQSCSHFVHYLAKNDKEDSVVIYIFLVLNYYFPCFSQANDIYDMYHT
jgi:hypothetical protein